MGLRLDGLAIGFVGAEVEGSDQDLAIDLLRGESEETRCRSLWVSSPLGTGICPGTSV